MKLDVELRNGYFYLNGEQIKKFNYNSLSAEILKYMISVNFNFTIKDIFNHIYDLEVDDNIYVLIHQINTKTLALFNEKFILNKKGKYYPHPYFNQSNASLFVLKLPKYLQIEFLDKYGDYLI